MASGQDYIVISDGDDETLDSAAQSRLRTRVKEGTQVAVEALDPDNPKPRKKRHKEGSEIKKNDDMVEQATRAIRNFRTQDLDILLKQRAPKLDVNVKVYDGHPQHSTLLHLCARLGRPDCAKLLLARGAKASIRDGSKASPLDEAVFSGQETMARLLVEGSCDPSIINDRRGTVLHTACSEGHIALVKWLVELGLDIEQQDEDGFTPLMWCTNASIHMTPAEKGQTKARKRSRELLPEDPQYAEDYRDDGHKTMAYLLSRGARIDALDFELNTTLMWASSYGNEAMVALLLRKNCKILSKNLDGVTALATDKTGLVIRELLWRAVEDGSIAEVRRILDVELRKTALPAERIPKFSSESPHHDTLFPSRLAPYPYFSAFAVAPLLDLGDIEESDSGSDGQSEAVTFSPLKRPTPLHLAVSHSSAEILEALVEGMDRYGAELSLAYDDVDFEGLHPIHRAVRLAKIQAVSTLLAGREGKTRQSLHCDSQATAMDSPRMFTPLMHATHIEDPSSRLAIFQLLLKHCDRVDQRDAWGNSVLTHAAARGQHELIEALHCHALQLGNQNDWFLQMLRTPNQWGNTPLHYSAKIGDVECTRLLLQYGLRPSLNLHMLGPLNLDVVACEPIVIPLLTSGNPSEGEVCVDLTSGKSPRIALVNTIDQTPRPKFKYVRMTITNRKHPVSVPSLTTRAKRCVCSECSDACGCVVAQGVRQCNRLCSCGPNCPFRYGDVAVSLQVFRKPGSWGVRTLEPLSPGQFVMRVTGELIPWGEARRRLRKRSVTLLFSFEDKSTPVLDLTRFGNVSRFLNTSCQPNLTIQKSFAHEAAYPKFPDLLLFASRPISALEELTFGHDPTKCLERTMQPAIHWNHFVL